MATTGSAQISNEVKPLYDAEFYMQGQGMVYYDQLYDVKPLMNGVRGSSLNWPLLASLNPNTAQLDELTDVTAQVLNISELSIPIYEYGGAVDVSKYAVAVSYADVYKQAAYANGYNLAESYDFIARATALQGSRQIFINGATARSSINGPATAAYRCSAAFLERMAFLARLTKMPLYPDGALCDLVHPWVMYDILQDAGVRQMSTYSYPELLFNGELAYWGGVRFIVSANAKAFWGAGAANASAVNTTLGSAVAAGSTTIVVAANTNINVGSILNVGTAETGNTWFDTNEAFWVTGVSGTTITGFAIDPGAGSGGGIRYAHASGTTVTNNASVYPQLLVGPDSLAKVASTFTGPYGETVVSGPFDRLGRYLTFGWYSLVGFGRPVEAWIIRPETGSSQA